MLKELLKSPLGRLRIVAFLEGCSFLLLGVTMLIKYKLLIPEPNYVIGMMHGLLFILYIFLVLQVAFLKKWSLMTVLWLFLASLIPFGTFYADKKILRNSILMK